MVCSRNYSRNSYGCSYGNSTNRNTKKETKMIICGLVTGSVVVSTNLFIEGICTSLYCYAIAKGVNSKISFSFKH